jgi:hypothetical protein
MEQGPKTTKVDLTASSDLLSRLGSFLPQLQAANELLAQEPNLDSLVDADLAIEEDGSEAEAESAGDDDSENEVGENDGDEQVDMKTGKPKQPTIQLTLAVGNIDENPGISWLAAQDEDQDDEEEAPNEDEAEPPTQAESTISSLLGKGKGKEQTRPKGPLITEMN